MHQRIISGCGWLLALLGLLWVGGACDLIEGGSKSSDWERPCDAAEPGSSARCPLVAEVVEARLEVNDDGKIMVFSTASRNLDVTVVAKWMSFEVVMRNVDTQLPPYTITRSFSGLSSLAEGRHVSEGMTFLRSVDTEASCSNVFSAPSTFEASAYAGREVYLGDVSPDFHRHYAWQMSDESPGRSYDCFENVRIAIWLDVVYRAGQNCLCL